MNHRGLVGHSSKTRVTSEGPANGNGPRHVHDVKLLRVPKLGIALISVFAAYLAGTPAHAGASILIEADSGKVLRAENATYPWYPASTTKLMTLYVTLQAIKQGRINQDTLFTVSRNAIAQSPTKMGYAVGTQVTVDNALKMMMVKSANDMAVLLAEGVDGSIENFADDMTKTAHRLGMSQSNFVNPNGLPADGQIVSARDMAILARALIRVQTGNLRYFDVVYCEPGELQQKALEHPSSQADGIILVPLCETKQETDAALRAARELGGRDDLIQIIAVPRPLIHLGSRLGCLTLGVGSREDAGTKQRSLFAGRGTASPPRGP